MGRKVSPSTHPEIERMYVQEQFCATEIARRVGLSAGWVGKILKSRGVTMRSPAASKSIIQRRGSRMERQYHRFISRIHRHGPKQFSPTH